MRYILPTIYAKMIMKSTKNKQLVTIGGYIYRIGRRTDDDVQWRCIKKTCSGRMKSETDTAENTCIVTKHDHAPSEDDVVIRQVRTVMNDRAGAETTPVNRIYKEETAKLIAKPMIAAVMPSYRHVQSAMYRRRHAMYPPLPSSRRYMDVPDCLLRMLQVKCFCCLFLMTKSFLLFAQLSA